MEKYCYSKDLIVTREVLLKEMDLSLFFDAQKASNTEKILNYLHIDPENLDIEGSHISIRIEPSQSSPLMLPNISNRYYDRDDQLFSQFSITCSDGTLLSLEGEIYEQLDSENRKQICEQGTAKEYIDDDTRSLIHFRGVEYNREKRQQYEEMLQVIGEKDLTKREQEILHEVEEKTKEIKEVYITKDHQMFYFYYNSPHIFNNLSTKDSLSVAEIGKIQSRILELLVLNGNQHMDAGYQSIHNYHDYEQFLNYVYCYLAQYREIVGNKGYQEKKIDVLDEFSLQQLEACLKGEIDQVYCKVTIISDLPIQTTEEKNRQFLKSFITQK